MRTSNTKSRTGRAACAVLTLLLLAIAGSAPIPVPALASTAANSPSPKAVSLTVRDLPKGFQQTQAKDFSHSYSGYTSYYVVFGKTTASPVPQVVKSTVALFPNEKAAVAGYPQIVSSQAFKKGFKKTGSVKGLGNQSTTGTMRTQVDNIPVSVYAVVFLRRQYVATVSVTGRTGTVTQSQANQLASTIDHRITILK
jgi:hypothetical protein